MENISEVDSQISNISGGGTSKKDDGEFGKYEVNSAVAAISSMFPTVDESHIRDLLKKWVHYHNLLLSDVQFKQTVYSTDIMKFWSFQRLVIKRKLLAS